jgi:polysaccharide export outer membrane protein
MGMRFLAKSSLPAQQSLVRRFALALLLLGASLPVFPQALPQTGFAPRQPDHAPTPADLLREFDAPPETDYRIAEGDIIQVDVWGRPELSGKHIVGPDGKITLPFAGTLKVANLTREEAEAGARTLWKDYFENLAVSASIEQYEGSRIFVLGRVTTPGVLHFERQPTLLEALSKAGTLPVTGSVTERNALTRCIIFRGSDKVAWIDLQGLLNGSNMAFNIHLQRDDTLYLPDDDDQLVYVLGEVQKPGAVRITQNMTFMSALAQAGGVTKDAGARIHLIRHSAGIDREISMNEILNSKRDPDVILRNGDILYVARSGLAKVGYVMQQLSPATSYVLFASGIKNF